MKLFRNRFINYLFCYSEMSVVHQLCTLTAAGSVVTILMGWLSFYFCGVNNRLIFFLWPLFSLTVFLLLFVIIKRSCILPMKSIMQDLEARLPVDRCMIDGSGEKSTEWEYIRSGLLTLTKDVEQPHAFRRDLLSCRNAQASEMQSLLQSSSKLEKALLAITEDATNLKLVGDEMKQDAMNIVDISNSSSAVSRQGIDYVAMSQRAMTEIHEAEQSVLKSNALVSEYVNEVNQIIVMVYEISAQSTLLAVNASIQAAKSGEAGRGFSVVAKEMKTLSVNSKTATKRASEAIKNIKSAISEMQQHVQEGQNRTKRGTDILLKTEDTISRLGGIITEISSVASMIATSAKEQSYGLAILDQSIRGLHHTFGEHRSELQKLRTDISLESLSPTPNTVTQSSDST